MRKLLLFAIILFLGFSAGAVAQPNVVDSISTIRSDEQKLQAIVTFVSAKNGDNLAAKIRLAELGQEIAADIGDERVQLILLSKLSEFWKDLNNFFRSSYFLDKALPLALKTGNKIEHARLLARYGEYCRYLGKYSSALDFLRQSKFEAEKEGFRTDLAMAENRLASVYFELFANYQPGYLNFDSTSPMVHYNKIAGRYIHDGYLDSIIYFAELSIKHGGNDLNGFYGSSNRNILGSTMAILHLYDKALTYLEDGLQIAKINKNIEMQEEVYHDICSFYKMQKKYRQALNFLLAADSLSNFADFKLQRRENYFELAQYYYLLGEYANSNKYVEQAKLLSTAISRDNVMTELISERVELEHKIYDERAVYEKKISTMSAIFVIIFLLVATTALFFLLKRKKFLENINAILNNKNQLIEEQHEELVQINSGKNKFFAIIAHDLRSPIWTILAYSEMLIEEYREYSEEQRLAALRSLNASINSLSELTQNLLSWAALQLNKSKPEFAAFSVKEVLDSVSHILETMLRNKEIVLVNSVPPDALIYADKSAFSVVVHNIISNAVKFTPRGGTIELSLERAGGGHEIAVKDNGRGMSQTVKDKLFVVGEKSMSPGTEGERGNGLGLLLCKELMVQNNGDIRVESEIDKGTTFYVSLPAGEGADGNHQSPEKAI